jgi:hypothetical protein
MRTKEVVRAHWPEYAIEAAGFELFALIYSSWGQQSGAHDPAVI